MAESKWTRHEVQFRGVPNEMNGSIANQGRLPLLGFRKTRGAFL